MKTPAENPSKNRISALIRHRRQCKVLRENRQVKLIADEDVFHGAICDKLEGLNETSQFANVRRCGQEKIFRTCKCCGAVDEFAYRCCVKWCPRCQWRIAEARRKKIAAWSKHVLHPKHVVTTCRNFPVLTGQKIRWFQVALAKLRRTVCWSEVKGGCVSIEITNEGNGWHLHAHWLVDATWIPASELAVTFGELVGQSFAIVKVLPVNEKTYLSEICKYLAKGSEIASWPAEQILEFTLAIYRKRFFFCFGSLFKMGQQIRDEIRKENAKVHLCDCGSHEFIFEDERQAILNEIRRQKRRR